jgi:ornithine cyclodeaminase/alanine dehydrogenase-like protein (mu-crystallin family)
MYDHKRKAHHFRPSVVLAVSSQKCHPSLFQDCFPMLVIDRATVQDLLPMKLCLDLMDKAMRAVATNKALMPLRTIIDLPGDDGNLLGLMPGHLAEPACFGTKVTAIYPGNTGSAVQSHQGAIILFDAAHGSPIAIVHGGEVTAIRTAAVSGVATRLLARANARRLAIIGTGEQALQHVEAMCLVRPIDSIVVWGRARERAAQLVEAASLLVDARFEIENSVERAVRDADIVCTVTAATDPILEGAWLPDGVHVNVVGSSMASAREVDSEAVKRSRLFVDYERATRSQGGEFLAALRERAIDGDHIVGELGQVLMGQLEGRRHDADITMFKGLGLVVEDLVVAQFLHDAAADLGRGIAITF